jgi:hypothetical protein
MQVRPFLVDSDFENTSQLVGDIEFCMYRSDASLLCVKSLSRQVGAFWELQLCMQTTAAALMFELEHSKCANEPFHFTILPHLPVFPM